MSAREIAGFVVARRALYARSRLVAIKRLAPELAGEPALERALIRPLRLQAPEQLAGEPVTGAPDQFGLGVTLVELVTGARAFAGETPWALRDAIRRAGAFEALAPDLAVMAARALAFEAVDRYPSVEQLRRAIAEAQQRRLPSTASDLGVWVRSRLTARGGV